MRYRKPFTPGQRSDAIREHRRMRKHYRKLKVTYPPRSITQRELLQSYRADIRQFGDELVRPLQLIDSMRLNDLLEHATAITVEYLFNRTIGGQHGA